jgi:hypothetical protein
MTQQEPVAWMYYDERKNLKLCQTIPPYDNSFPVYTAPKELSDDEISDSTKQFFNIHSEAKLSEQFRIKLYELEDFAKAILKKASEK